MNYSLQTIPKFDKQFKRLVKKYPSFKRDFIDFLPTLLANPTIGSPIGKNCYKIRFAILSKSKGKRGGARIISNVIVTEKIVYLLTIYDKSEKGDLSNDELEKLLEQIPD